MQHDDCSSRTTAPGSLLAPLHALFACATLAAVLTMHAPRTMHAQAAASAPESSSIWYGVSFGGAGTRLTCDICQTQRDVGPSLSLSFGAYARRQLRIGVEASRWTFGEQSVREQVHTLGLVAHVIPAPRRGLFLLGGIGWSGYRAGDFSYDAPRVSVGAGWDLPITSGWVIGNVVSLDAASFAPLKNDDVTVMRSVGLSSVRVAVQLRKR